MSYGLFEKQIQSDEYLDLVSVTDKSCIVKNIATQKKYKIEINTIEQENWKNLKDILNGRDTHVVDGITRIVGYYSKVKNWNKSKLGELEDRQKGTYAIEN